MKSWEREERTHLDIVARFVDLAGLEADEARVLKAELVRYMRTRLLRKHWLPGEITRFHTEWYRELYRTLRVADPYAALKERSDALARAVLAEVELPTLRTALLASIVANRLDFGVAHATGEELPVALEDFRELDTLPLWADDGDALERDLAGARTLLYLPDNHGEIVFDRAVIDRARAANPRLDVHVACKSAPMLNDVTLDEARALGLGDVATLHSTGSNCFGVPRDEVSAEFLAVFESADVVVAKGQAYLEFWIEHGVLRLYNVAFTKIPIHDAVLGTIPAGVALVLASSRYAAGKPAY